MFNSRHHTIRYRQILNKISTYETWATRVTKSRNLCGDLWIFKLYNRLRITFHVCLSSKLTSVTLKKEKVGVF